MLSRVADALYWMGRYLERAENVARLLLVTEDFATETQALDEDLAQTAWKDLRAIFPGAQLTRAVPASAPQAVPYLAGLFLDPQNPYSIHSSLRKARENARAVREALTVEVFVALNETFRELEAYDRRGLPDLPGFRDALSATHKGLFGVMGAAELTLTRDEGWHFLRLGEALERAYRTALVLRAKLPALLAPGPRTDVPLYDTQWRCLLRSLSSLENYRRAAGARMEPTLVVPFLLFDPHSPRSLRHGTAAVKACLDRISGADELSSPARLVGKFHADLCYQDDALGSRGDLTGFLDRVLGELARAHDALTAQYFAT